MEEVKKYNHFLVVGKVMFTVPSHQNEMSELTVNAIIVGEGTDIPVRVIGKAQQAVQMQFHNHAQDPEVKVLDVVIVNLIHLGLMTKEEFQKPPVGMELMPMDDVDTFADQPASAPIKDEAFDPLNPFH